MSATAQVNGVRLHYVLEGDGPLVVLLHGWPQTGYCWRNVIGALAAGHTVLAPDLRGYGLSDKPPSGYDKRISSDTTSPCCGTTTLTRPDTTRDGAVLWTRPAPLPS